MADTGMDCGRRTGGPLHGNLQDVMNKPNGIGFRFPDWGDGRERRSGCVNWIWASDEALTVVDSGV
uniref:Uncharacterized protein n=1 Tax=Oryza rufipogon TaxID=4529 RepID=A0A0E0QKJ3_ORYRU